MFSDTELNLLLKYYTLEEIIEWSSIGDDVSILHTLINEGCLSERVIEEMLEDT